MPRNHRAFPRKTGESSRPLGISGNVAEYVLSRSRDKTYSRGVISTCTSPHSSVGISASRRSISASPVETIWITAAWPKVRSRSIAAISEGVFIAVIR